MVNENHFQFDCKSLFNFWKTIYGFENCKSFSEFKLFILARTFVGIRHLWALEFVGNPTLPSKIPEFWYPIARIRRHWHHCRNPATSPGSGGLDSGELVRIRRRRSDVAGFYFTSLVFFRTS
jgi:hypothetical protein